MSQPGDQRAHACRLSAARAPPACRLRRLRRLLAVSASDVRAANLYRSSAALRAEKHRQYLHYPMSIHPFSALRIWCEALFFLAMLISQSLLAVRFGEPVPLREDYRLDPMYAYEILYAINVVINLLTGYVEGDTCRSAVLDLRKIWWRYATSWLAPDAAAAGCALATPLVPRRLAATHAVLGAAKLLRLPAMLAYLDNVLTVMRVEIFKRTVIQITILMCSYVTWNIYFQFAVEYALEGSARPARPQACSWMSIANLWNQTADIRLAYALDRAVGMLRKNTNINLISKDGCFENFFAISWLVAKMLVYHCALKYIITLFGSESAKAKYFIMTKQVETYTNIRKFPPRIKRKIMKFYAIRYQSHYFEESKMLACVTGQLREDILMHTGRQLVQELACLRRLPRALLLQVGLQLRVVIFIAGDVIFKVNTVGDCLYFIDRGTVAIYSESGAEVCHLEDGDLFGEIALVMARPFRAASAVAVTNCELFRLDKERFATSIACYPTVYQTIRREALHRRERSGAAPGDSS